MKNTTTRTTRANLGRLYTVDSLKGMESVGWRSGNQARSVAKVAATHILDRGADRVFVHREGEAHPVATWQVTGGWRFGPNCEPRLKAMLEESGL